MLWPEKNSYKEFNNEKKFLRLENSPPTPPPPNNFSNGPSLNFSGSKNLSFILFYRENLLLDLTSINLLPCINSCN